MMSHNQPPPSFADQDHSYQLPRPVTKPEPLLNSNQHSIQPQQFEGPEWKYEMRRQCQEIMPSFFLGPSEVSKSLPLLQSLQITSIVILRAQHESMFIKARFPQVLNYHTLDVEDREDQNLIRIYSSARDFIDQEIAKGGKVLVHDDGGISRAPAFAVMFTMEKMMYSYEQAMLFVQARRYCMHLNAGFMNQCKEFEALCSANAVYCQHAAANEAALRAQIESSTDTPMDGTSQGNNAAPMPRRKRELSNDEEVGDVDQRVGPGPASAHYLKQF